MYLHRECWTQFPPSPPDSVWGQQHQTAPTESTCSPLSPPTIAFVLALSSPSGYDPQQAAPNSWGCSTKEPRLCPTTKRNYKPASWEHQCLMPPPQNMEGSSSLCATLHGLCPSHVRVGSPLWAQTWGAAAPPSTPTVLYTTDNHPSTPLTATQHPTDIHPNCAAHHWQPPSTPLTVTKHPISAVQHWQPPQYPTDSHPAPQLCCTALTAVFGSQTDKKHGENYTCPLAGERQLSNPHVQTEGKEHFQIRGCLQLSSQNLQPISKLGMLIYPAAATSHVSCLGVTGKQLPKPLEVHISILRLRLF